MTIHPSLILDTHLRIRGIPADHRITQMLCQAATVENPEWESAQREHIFGVPKYLTFYEVDDNEIILPLGMEEQVRNGFTRLKIDYEVHERRPAYIASDYTIYVNSKQIEMRPYQREVIRKMMNSAAGGIVDCPTGSGKTVIALGFLKETGLSGLILVDRVNLVDQWNEAVRKMWGERLPINISVRTVQGMSREIFEKSYTYGAVILDECHHVSARTYMETVQKFASHYRFGLSATPDKNETLSVAKLILGPIIAKVTKAQLREEGWITKPKVRIVKSSFDFPYVGSYRSPIGKFVRNNYMSMMEAIVEDRDRNRLILDLLRHYADRGRTILVTSRRIKHLELLYDKWFLYTNAANRSPSYPHPVMLVGTMSAKDRQEAIWQIEQGTVVFSTLADEALDIPLLDTIVLTYPSTKPDVVKQQIGRIERMHDDKKSSLVIDITDPVIPVLRQQGYRRRVMLYNLEGYEVDDG